VEEVVVEGNANRPALGTISGVFYSNERGDPPHVHVRSGSFEAKFWLHDLSVAVNAGFPAHESALLSTT
jgi:hypothetical protein